MNRPLKGDYIDIHTHDSVASAGIFAIENLMAHEPRSPADMPSRVCTFGIHPWHLGKETIAGLIEKVRNAARSTNLIAIGEAGFDKLRGPEPEIQAKAFEEQVMISEEIKKPLFIHCVRAWDDLLPAHKRLRPKMPWLIHGFRGKPELAQQLIAKGMYLSFWFDFVIRTESSELLRSLPRERIFLETDGADVDIRTIYDKVAADLDMQVDELKAVVMKNYNEFFSPLPND
jgi:TatD DNase family protein